MTEAKSEQQEILELLKTETPISLIQRDLYGQYFQDGNNRKIRESILSQQISQQYVKQLNEKGINPETIDEIFAIEKKISDNLIEARDSSLSNLVTTLKQVNELKELKSTN